MTPFSISRLSAILVVKGGSGGEDTLPLAGLSCQFGADAPNMATCRLAVGWLGSVDGRVVERLSYERGTAAEIVVEVGNALVIGGASNAGARSRFVLFRGYVDDIGPSTLTAGAFTVDVRLHGRLNSLNTGTLQSGLYTGGEIADFANPYPNAVGTIPLIFNREKTLGDFGIGFLQGLYGMATQNDVALASTLARQLAEKFGNKPNLEAARILAALDSTVNWAPGLDPGTKEHIVNLLERWNQSDFRYDSFYTRLLQLGQLLGFRVTETGSRLSLVPYTPFASSARCTTIQPDTISGISRSVGDARQYSGIALVGSRDSSTAVYAGIYRRPGGSVGFRDGDITGRDPGQILVTDAPAWLRTTTSPSTGNTQGLPDIDRGNSGYTPNPGLVEGWPGDAIAREFLMSANYRARSYTVTSPYLRPDLTPLMPVKIAYPRIPGAPSQRAVYGSIQSINVDIDAQSPSVTTTIRVGYARSALQQQLEIDDTPYAGSPHPIWSSSFASLRLDADSNGSPHRISPKSGW